MKTAVSTESKGGLFLDKFSLSFYDYDAPLDLIAQKPAGRRDQSRLLTVNRKNNRIGHAMFSDIAGMLEKGDCLVINDTKVIPARLKGKKSITGASIEILLSSCIDNIWEAMMKNSRRVKPGDFVEFGEGLKAEVTEKHGKTVSLKFNKSGSEFYGILNKCGEIPLPPYIKEGINHPGHMDRYQTVYAKNEGASAAPTAGLHFTNALLDEIRNKGVKIAKITLHTGLGTFEPVTAEDIRQHKMHEEWFNISKENADIINSARDNNKRIIAVGTTSLRTIESAADKNGRIEAKTGKTGIFIYPGYTFKITDALITNFHLPKTTLLALVHAFAGSELIKRAYNEAIKEKYRLFSYGDAMFIL